jgi:hypothetical protein
VWEAIASSEWTARYGYRALSEYDLGGAIVTLANEQMRSMGLAKIIIDGEVIVTVALRSLERRGVVQCQPGQERQWRAPPFIDEGRFEMLVAAIPIWCAEHAALVAELSESNAAGLRALLPTIKNLGKGAGNA